MKLDTKKLAATCSVILVCLLLCFGMWHMNRRTPEEMQLEQKRDLILEQLDFDYEVIWYDGGCEDGIYTYQVMLVTNSGNYLITYESDMDLTEETVMDCVMEKQ